MEAELPGTALAARWAWAMVVVTTGALALAVVVAPAGSARPGPGLILLLFLGSSVHITATAWPFTARGAAAVVAARPVRFIWVPIALVLGAAAVASLASPSLLRAALPAFFGWQLWHYGRQNLGLAALAASGCRVRALSQGERAPLTAASLAGVVGLLAHPRLLQLTTDPHLGLLFSPALVTWTLGSIVGVVTVLRRAPLDRPAPFVAMYVLALGFWFPVFVFASPYAAAGSLVIAHGLQYLTLTMLVAADDRSSRRRARRVGLLAGMALVPAVALAVIAHLHDAPVSTRWLYGAYLGVVGAHFVVDAGFWRLHEPTVRRLLGDRLPFLVPCPAPRRQPPADGSAADGSVADLASLS